MSVVGEDYWNTGNPSVLESCSVYWTAVVSVQSFHSAAL